MLLFKKEEQFLSIFTYSTVVSSGIFSAGIRLSRMFMHLNVLGKHLQPLGHLYSWSSTFGTEYDKIKITAHVNLGT